MSEGVVKLRQSPEEITAYMESDLEFNIASITDKQANARLKAISSNKECAKFLRTSNLWSPEKSWKGIPKKAKSYRVILSSLHDIILDVFQHFNYTTKAGDGTRTPKSPNKNPSPRRTRSQTKATPLPIGSAPEPERGIVILPPSDRVGPREHKPQPDGIITGFTNHFQPDAAHDSWRRTLAAFDVQTDFETQTDDPHASELWLYHLGYYAQEMFATQKTRQFVHGVIFTETRLRIYRLDRCGALEFPWLDYHDDPMILVRALLLIGNHDLNVVGVDPTVTFNTENQRVFNMTRNGKPVTFTESETIFTNVDLLDRATECWSVKDKDGKVYLLKQQFVEPTKTSEWTFLKGLDIPGVVKVHFEQQYDLMSKSRGFRKPYQPSFFDRRMVRGIYDQYGSPVDDAPSRLALIVAIHDAIVGHKELWIKHKILHGDVSFGNIVYPRESDGQAIDSASLERPHGILIDFDFAIHWDPSLPRKMFEVNGKVIKPAFRSTMDCCVDVLNDERKAMWMPLHDHIEELEAFFWVLYWSTNLFPPPDDPEYQRLRDEYRAEHGTLNGFKEPKSDGPLWKEFRNSEDYHAAMEYKLTVIRPLSRKQMAVAGPGWGPAINDLIHTFASFCSMHWDKKIKSAIPGPGKKNVPPTMEDSRKTAPKDYDMVLKFFKKAIQELEKELAAPKPAVNSKEPTKASMGPLSLPRTVPAGKAAANTATGSIMGPPSLPSMPAGTTSKGSAKGFMGPPSFPSMPAGKTAKSTLTASMGPPAFPSMAAGKTTKAAPTGFMGPPALPSMPASKPALKDTGSAWGSMAPPPPPTMPAARAAPQAAVGGFMGPPPPPNIPAARSPKATVGGFMGPPSLPAPTMPAATSLDDTASGSMGPPAIPFNVPTLQRKRSREIEPESPSAEPVLEKEVEEPRGRKRVRSSP